MKMKLLGAIDYAKLKKILKNVKSEEVIAQIEQLETDRSASIVSAAANLSRFDENVFEALGASENQSFEENVKHIKRVIKLGHESIMDHDYCVFAIQDVSPVIEQTIIAERFSSFTIKSRREVDFSKVGYYTPTFRSVGGGVLSNNKSITQEYQQYMNSLFQKYDIFLKYGIEKEDARFVLPYCYHSNIIMGIDAHTLKDMIVKFTKTKYANIQELKEFGERLYEIAKIKVPYIIEEIDKIKPKYEDNVDVYLAQNIKNREYKILTAPKLLNSTTNVDDAILISAIMRRYQYDYEYATRVYQELCRKNPNFKLELMQKIAFESDQLELTQASFEFQIPLSFAVLTHLTRHRTHDIVIPDFVPIVDLLQYKTPPKIKNICQEEFHKVFELNNEMYHHFKEDYGVCEEDLIYFILSGNMVNIVTNMNGKTVKHILGLRECTRAQWETRDMAIGMHKEIDTLPDAQIFSKVLGPTCTTQGYCKEGKRSCGRILALKE